MSRGEGYRDADSWKGRSVYCVEWKLKRSMKPEQQSQMDEFQQFVNECCDEMEVGVPSVKATPVKTMPEERMTTPTVEKSVPLIESQLSAKKRSLHMTELDEGTVKSRCQEESDESFIVTRKHRTITLSDSDYECLFSNRE